MNPKLIAATLLLAALPAAGLLGAARAVSTEPGTADAVGTTPVAAANASAAARYAAECGSCHLAYSPRLLPARSWERIMGGLADHFGDNAELDPATLRVITQYLVDNAGSPRPNAPLRITEQRWFVHEHDELPARMVAGNPQVRSLSNCAACHRRADRGYFNEHDVIVPGFGRWDD
jgi:cytochrome c553